MQNGRRFTGCLPDADGYRFTWRLPRADGLNDATLSVRAKSSADAVNALDGEVDKLYSLYKRIRFDLASIVHPYGREWGEYNLDDVELARDIIKSVLKRAGNISLTNLLNISPYTCEALELTQDISLDDAKISACLPAC